MRRGEFEHLEGSLPLAQVMVVEFAAMDAARKFYHFPEYREVLKIQQAAAECQVFLVDGA